MSQTETLAKSYSDHQPHPAEELSRRRLEKDDKRQAKFVNGLGAVTVAFLAGVGANHLIQQNTAPNSTPQPKAEHITSLPGTAEGGLPGASNSAETPKP